MLVSMTDDIANIPTANFLVKEVDTEELGIPVDEKFNLARYQWHGDYDSGKIVDLFAEKKAIVTEQEINQKYYEIFFRKFRIEDIIFALLSDDYSVQKEFLLKLMDKKKKEIDFYSFSANHIYESLADQEKRINQTFDVK